MKFHLYKRRSAAHVKVPLATPEIIEFNESLATPFSIKQNNDKSLVLTNNNTDDMHPVNSSSSSPPTIHQQHQNHSSTIDESITDSSKQTRGLFLKIKNILFKTSFFFSFPNRFICG
jgi:hypothetical protein